MEQEGSLPIYQCEVDGSSGSTYRVCVNLDNISGKVDFYSCSCPAANRYDGACKHVVALLKAIQLSQEKQQVKTDNALLKVLDGAEDSEAAALLKAAMMPASELQKEQAKQRAASHKKMDSQEFRLGQDMFHYFAQEEERKRVVSAQPLYLVPKFCVSHAWRSIDTNDWLEFRIGQEKLYVVRSVSELMKNYVYGIPMQFGKGLVLDFAHEKPCFADDISRQLWQMLEQSFRDELYQSSGTGVGYSYYQAPRSDFQKKAFCLSASTLNDFLDIMQGSRFAFQVDGAEEEDIAEEAGIPKMRVRVEAEGSDAHIMLQSAAVVPLMSDCSCVVSEGKLYRIPAKQLSSLRPLIETFQQSGKVSIDSEKMGDFFTEVMPRIDKAAKVEIQPSLLEKYQFAPLQAELYLDYYKDGISARLIFSYAGRRYNPLIAAAPAHKKDEPNIIHDAAAEREILGIFQQYGFEESGEYLLQPEEEQTYSFLVDGLPQLSDKADVYYSEVFRKKPVQQMTGLSVGVSVNEHNLLEVSVRNQDFDFDELINILASYQKKQRYHRLKDGTFVTLAEQQMGLVSDLVDSMGLEKGMLEGDKVELPLSSAMYLDSLAREQDGFQLKRSQTFKALVRDIRDPEDADVEVPPALDGVLRGYQETGYAWLTLLSHYGLGGILADDMGLGKTLQVIAFLLGQQKSMREPALVVAPTSLVYNWLDEIQRFAPDMKAMAVAGTREERMQSLRDGQDMSVLITTYNMLKRDIRDYEKYHFSYCFLDEAQQIKNPTTQNAKAVKKLHCGGRFALTGTPIENTLTELWSIFDFLMPGYLFRHKEFKRRYEVPIVRRQDVHAAKELNRHIQPFIMRRLKKDVLKELPDKIERKMVNEMTPQQAKVYAAYFVQGKKEFVKELQAHGFQGSRMKILAILTRLRQIACDPSLFLDNYEGGSGKLDMLEEVMQDAVEAGHRVLIFSQFTTMLSHIADRLQGMSIEYSYLDGSTPALERIQLVKAFNSGSQPVFLISLKAGGTGLNLTGADMVIHYDPWWNPAVEDQATDRAYRIGQRNNVQVLKFITKNTIEERIFDLQEKKKALIDQMIQPGETFLSKLSEAEITELFD
jgi:SNF2 family DNA or RNA helicase